MIDVTIELPISPVAKGRPRAMATKHGARMYTPKKTRLFECRLADLAAERLPAEPLEGPIRVDIAAVLPRPGRLLRKKDPPGLVWATKRPDADNIRKAILDALKRHWRDDAQVCDGRTLKMYSEKDGLPRTVIRIMQLSDASDTLSLLEERDQVGFDFLHNVASR